MITIVLVLCESTHKITTGAHKHGQKDITENYQWRIQGGARQPHPLPRGSKFFNFYAVFGKIRVNTPTLGVLHPPLISGDLRISHTRATFLKNLMNFLKTGQYEGRARIPWIRYCYSQWRIQDFANGGEAGRGRGKHPST